MTTKGYSVPRVVWRDRVEAAVEENNSNSRGLMWSIRGRVPAKARVENVE